MMLPLWIATLATFFITLAGLDPDLAKEASVPFAILLIVLVVLNLTRPEGQDARTHSRPPA